MSSESKSRVNIIAAIGNNNALGRNNKIPWHLPPDLKHFKKLTKGHPIIMGRKTFESIVAYLGGPLPHRANIILTRDSQYSYEGCIIAHSMNEAIAKAFDNDSREIFIAGGAEIYKQGMSYTDRMYLTKIDIGIPDADTYFPDYSEFSKVIESRKETFEGIDFEWLILERQQSTS